MIKIYGIKNCNTVKAAIQWLEQRRVPYEFHDYKKLGASRSHLESWSKQVGWETLVNKRGTTWRQLSAGEQARVVDATSAIQLMHEKTSVIKRPLVEENGKVVLVGFDEAEWLRRFS